jgi:cardiolipin synthase
VCGLVWGGEATRPQDQAADVTRQSEVQEAARELAALATAVQDKKLTAAQAQAAFFDLVVRLNQQDRLRPALAAALEIARKAPGATAGAIPPAVLADQSLVDRAADMIDAELSLRGRGRFLPPFPYEDWTTLTEKLGAAVRSDLLPSRRRGEPSRLSDPRFLAEIERLAKTTFVAGGHRVRVLVDGPASFAVRERLIAEAKVSLWIMSWAFYDDRTGLSFAQKLIDRHAQGVDVRIMVDGAVAEWADHDEVTARLEAAGIPVIRWRSAQHPYFGMHRKLLIADQRSVVCGGMNFGDVYSHLGVQDEHRRWRDTDVLIEGPAVAQAVAIFVRRWNEAAPESQRMVEPKAAKRPPGKSAPSPLPSETGQARIAFVDHHPIGCAEDPIYLLTLKAIAGATEVIEINNAYFLPSPPLKAALLDALRRGVRVRILSNSAESLDTPILRRPMIRGMIELRDAGAEVFIKRGSTLHSKIFVADRRFGWVGSYNLHPRSYRYEGETVAAFWSSQVGRELSDVFVRDAATAQPLKPGEPVEVPESLLSELTVQYFFDQL